MSALWLLKVQTSKNLPFFFCCCKLVSMFYRGMYVCFCLYVGECEHLECAFWSSERCRKVWFSHYQFSGCWCLQKRRIFTRAEFTRPPLPLIQHDTVRNLQRKWPKSNRSCLTGKQKTIRDKHPNQPHMKVSVRPERGAEMQREFIGIRNELWGGQPCSRVNFTEGPK